MDSAISNNKWLRLGLPAGFAVLLWVFGLFPRLVEQLYTNGIYPGISLMLRMIAGLVPFSVGDILYLVLVVWILISVIKSVIIAFRVRFAQQWILRYIYLIVRFLLWAFIVFKLLWGFNYNRLGIAYQLGIDKKTYSKEEIISLTDNLIEKVNECRRQIPDTVLPVLPLDSVYEEAFHCYQTVSNQYNFLSYSSPCIKASLFSTWGNYLGFTGYFNPFTGEAQVRSDIPRILVPYITCHEMAHQLGYGSESEANFVGYLAASASTNAYFRYSVYLELLSYAQGEEMYLLSTEGDFQLVDSIAKHNRMKMDTLVKNDRRAIRKFFASRKNAIAPAVNNLYHQYLKINQQPDGIKSYDKVVGWLIAYRKKSGKV